MLKIESPLLGALRTLRKNKTHKDDFHQLKYVSA